MAGYLNYERLYKYRFKEIDQRVRQRTWDEIAPFVYRLMGAPQRVLDPAAGRGEFVNALPGIERWIVDTVDHVEGRDPAIKAVISDIFDADLPRHYFDGIFVSNFLEHLESHEQIARFLSMMLEASTPDGQIVVMGPNFRFCYREYFDCADHTLALTHTTVAEHLYAAGFQVTQIRPQFLPYSFRKQWLPTQPVLTRWYLRVPQAWRLLGKQFLIVASPDSNG